MQVFHIYIFLHVNNLERGSEVVIVVLLALVMMSNQLLSWLSQSTSRVLGIT